MVIYIIIADWIQRHWGISDEESMNAEDLAEVVVYSKQIGVDVDAPRRLVAMP